MKELSIEEKVYDGNYKAYTELINRLEDVKDAIKKQNYGIAMDILCKPYPEHQITISTENEEKSDGERIRKGLIEACKQSLIVGGIHKDKVISWLEKQGEKNEEILILKDQIESLHAAIKAIKEAHRIELEKNKSQGKNNMGISEATKQKLEDKLHEALEKETPESFNKFLDEQKPADKVEQKFEIGDLITNGILVGKIDEIHKWGYHAFFGDHYADVPDVENWHKWTIQDAKDGDVLYNKDDFAGNSVFIYKGISDKETHTYLYYIRLFRDKDFSIYNDVMWGNGAGVSGGEFYPATEEQRDLLFQKMKEAGYEWDAEKKELKEIEQKPAECRQETKPNNPTKWNEEDETRLNRLCGLLVGLPLYQNWLKSLKDRVQPQQQEWSEKDERMFKNTIALIETLEDYNKAPNGFGDVKFWLKSLRERYAWKPSDEQIKVCKEVYADILSAKGFDLGTVNGELNRMEEELKKLRKK